MRDFSHLNTGRFSGLRIWGLVTIFSMIMGGAIAFFVFYFSVKEVIIHKDENDLNIRHGEILQMLQLVKGKNLFILSEDFLEKQLQIRFPELDSVIIEKDYPQTLRVQVKTSPIVLRLVYSVEGELEKFRGYIGEKGRFFINGDDSVFTVYEQNTRKDFIQPLDKIFKKEEISEIFEGKKMLEAVTKRKIVSADLLKNAQEIHFVDEKDIRYWLFLGKDFDVQISKLERTLQEKNIYEKPLLYVDLRIGRKVIYKNK